MSRRQVVVPRGLVAVRRRDEPGAASVPTPRTPEGGAPDADAEDTPEANPVGAPKPPAANRALPALDLKAVQRKAFERGREHALAEVSATVDAASATMCSAANRLAQARVNDRSELTEFVVRLACTIAEELTASVVDAEQHDVRGLVKRVLDSVLPELAGEPVTLSGHPEDLGVLPQSLTEDGLTLKPDPTFARGAFRVTGGDAEMYSGISERLEQMRERLLSEAEHGPA
ncbi:MAG: hypothetical protein CMJ83_02840 [Planctomycetes bacterium]|nr:hypothetical protein [Planctomycetota bacterium]